MAKFNISGDTENGEISVSIGDQEILSISDARVYVYSAYDGDQIVQKVGIEICSIQKENGVMTHTRIVASPKENVKRYLGA